MGWFGSRWEVLENRVFGEPMTAVTAFVSDYTSLRFAYDRPGINGIDREPSLASA